MVPRAPFFDGLNKEQTKAKVRELLDSVPFGEGFESAFLSDLIRTKHYYCSRHGLRPARFRKLRHPDPRYDYDLQGWFAERETWHGVSWYQCVNPRRDQDWIRSALRDAIAPEMARYRREHPTCERCARVPSEEVHHAAPMFKEMVAEAVDALSEDDWNAIVDRFDWWSLDPFSLPEDSPALAVFRAAHDQAALQAVCTRCHDELEDEKRRRR